MSKNCILGVYHLNQLNFMMIFHCGVMFFFLLYILLKFIFIRIVSSHAYLVKISSRSVFQLFPAVKWPTRGCPYSTRHGRQAHASPSPSPGSAWPRRRPGAPPRGVHPSFSACCFCHVPVSRSPSFKRRCLSGAPRFSSGAPPVREP